MRRALAFLAFLASSAVLAQPAPPSGGSCGKLSATCKAGQFSLLTGHSLCLNSTTCSVTIKAATNSTSAQTNVITLTDTTGVQILGPAAGQLALSIPDGAYLDFQGGTGNGLRYGGVFLGIVADTAPITGQGIHSGSNDFYGDSNLTVTYNSAKTNAANAVAHTFETLALTTGSTLIAAFNNNTVQKSGIDKDGNPVPTSDESATLGRSDKRWAYVFTDGLKDQAPVLRVGTGGGSGNTYQDNVGAPGAGSVAHSFDTTNAYSTAGGKLASWKNATTAKASISRNGSLGGTYTDTTGTPGNATANSVTGKSSIASGQSSVVITNALVTSTSVVMAILTDFDHTTGMTPPILASSTNGSFGIYLTGGINNDIGFTWIVFDGD